MLDCGDTPKCTAGVLLRCRSEKNLARATTIEENFLVMDRELSSQHDARYHRT